LTVSYFWDAQSTLGGASRLGLGGAVLLRGTSIIPGNPYRWSARPRGIFGLDGGAGDRSRFFSGALKSGKNPRFFWAGEECGDRAGKRGTYRNKEVASMSSGGARRVESRGPFPETSVPAAVSAGETNGPFQDSRNAPDGWDGWFYRAGGGSAPGEKQSGGPQRFRRGQRRGRLGGGGEKPLLQGEPAQWFLITGFPQNNRRGEKNQALSVFWNNTICANSRHFARLRGKLFVESRFQPGKTPQVVMSTFPLGLQKKVAEKSGWARPPDFLRGGQAGQKHPPSQKKKASRNKGRSKQQLGAAATAVHAVFFHPTANRGPPKKLGKRARYPKEFVVRGSRLNEPAKQPQIRHQDGAKGGFPATDVGGAPVFRF